MALALCLMVDDPPTSNTPMTTEAIAGTASEPVVIVEAQDVVVSRAEYQTVAHERDALAHERDTLYGRIDALRGQYQAVVHERDTLLTKLERYERMEKVTLVCDGCKSTYVFVGPAPAETRALGSAIVDGWTIVGVKHYCKGCRR